MFPNGAEDEDAVDDLDAAFAAFGLQPDEDIELNEVFHLWPENVPLFEFWLTVQSQWLRAEDGRRTGLNYGGVEVCLSYWPIKKKQRREYFWLVQTMESAVLSADSERS